ncbi:TonB-dependent siderophore receptor [Delftia acidovorans]|uniref:TonB-dependent siderophore receptor n=1 Tax=Delftia acidovorans TaxID=80866 RepID=UPI001EDCB675|nr:TonB-dependent siderophore receptor [Delftia acidovorans]MCG3784702.1 TonB-dependent siderophore receptor [Delftia acidovorans]
MDSSSMKAARPLVLRPLPLALCLAFATGGSARLHAETQAVDAGSAPETAALPGITVRASAVTGTGVDKLGQSLQEIAQSVTVIGQERMREQNLYSLDDVMQNAPGVTVQPFQLLTTGYYQRGFKIDSFQQDGVPILMGNTASPRMDMAMYERVEIVRGAAGLLHGTGNPAATVNLVPKRPTREFAGSAGLTLGSWGRRRAEADVGGPLNASGSLRARVVATQEERDFFYDVAGERTGNLFAIAELDLAPGTTVHAGVHHQRIRSTTNMAGVPFYADGRDVGLPRSTYLDAAWDRFDWNTTRSFAGVEHVWSNGWQARLNLNHLSGDSELLYAGANGAVNPATGLGGRLTGAAYRFDDSQTSVDAFASGPVQLWGRTHELLAGFNHQRTRSTQWAASILNLPQSPVDVWNWNPHGVPLPLVGSYATRGPTETRQSGLYGMARLQLADPLKLVLGGRFTRWEQETGGAGGAASRVRTRMGTQFTPYAGLVYALGPQWNAYASHARILQPQSSYTYAGELLDPVQGNNLEAGIKGALLGGRLNLGLALFEIRQKNRAQADPAHPCVGNACWYIATGEVRSRGLEAEIEGQPHRDLRLSASYTWNRTQYLQDAQNQGLPFASFTPRHILRLWASYQVPVAERRFSIGLGLRAQSDFYNQAQGVTLRQGGYALASLRLGWRINRQLTAALQVDNLTDRRYYQSLSGTGWNNRYGEPRSATLSLRAEF